MLVCWLSSFVLPAWLPAWFGLAGWLVGRSVGWWVGGLVECGFAAFALDAG